MLTVFELLKNRILYGYKEFKVLKRDLKVLVSDFKDQTQERETSNVKNIQQKG